MRTPACESLKFHKGCMIFYLLLEFIRRFLSKIYLWGIDLAKKLLWVELINDYVEVTQKWMREKNDSNSSQFIEHRQHRVRSKNSNPRSGISKG